MIWFAFARAVELTMRLPVFDEVLMTYTTERNERLAIERPDNVDLTSNHCNIVGNCHSCVFHLCLKQQRDS